MKGLYNPFTGGVRIKKALAVTLVLASSILPILSSQAAAAGTATITFSPSSGSFDINTQFTVTVYENSGGTSVSGVEADFTYDQAKLQLLNIDASTSAFDLQGANSGGGGSVSIARAKSGAGVTGSQVIAKVNFKALVGSGSAVLKLVNTSDVQDSSTAASVWDGALNSATFTLTTPTPTPSTPPTTTTSNPPATTTTTTTTPKTTTTTPKTTTTTPTTTTTTPTAPVTTAPNPSATTPPTTSESPTASPPTKVQSNSFAKMAFISAGAIIAIVAGLGIVRFVYTRQQEARILANYYRTPGAPAAQDVSKNIMAEKALEAQAQANMPTPSTVVQPNPQAQPPEQSLPGSNFPRQNPPL